MKIWLDDIRPAPEGWVQAETAEEAITLILAGAETISLDHDLGFGRFSGYEVACFIERGAFEGWLPRMECAVHSANWVGRERMLVALKKAKEYWDAVR